MKRTAFHIFLGAIGLLLLAGVGCTFISKSVFSSSVQYDGRLLVHKVNWEGETLSLVAKWYTGSLENWRAIAEANPALDPKKITIGSAILIPSALLITRKPMPRGFLSGETEINTPPAAADTPARREADMTKEPGPGPDAKGRSKPDTAPGLRDITSKPAPPKVEYRSKTAPPSASEPARRPPPISPPASTVSPGPEKKTGASKSEPPAEKEEEPPLFGPKDYRN